MTDPRFSEYVRSHEWRCINCGYVNTVDQSECEDCGADTDSKGAITETDIMAMVVFNSGCDPADEAAVIRALMNVGYRCREIVDKIEIVKLKAWAKRFQIAPERLGLADGA